MLELPGLLLRLLIGVLVYWIGEKIIALLHNPEVQSIFTIVLIVAIVVYVIFGGPLR